MPIKNIISNEVRGEIFCDLQFKPCIMQKISPHPITLSIAVCRNDIAILLYRTHVNLLREGDDQSLSEQ
jgi:hypothetical protein